MKMTKEQAIQTLESLLLNIAGEKDCEAIELAIAALQSDPDAPDLSRGAGAKGGEGDSVSVKLPKL
jgi:hypothetical protein